MLFELIILGKILAVHALKAHLLQMAEKHRVRRRDL